MNMNFAASYFARCQFDSVAQDENYYYFSSISENGLYRVKKGSCSAEFLGFFPDEPLSAARLYTTDGHVDNYIVFAPIAASNIAIYNIARREFTNIELRKDLLQKCKYKSNKFWNVVVFQKHAYIFGVAYPAIVRINLETFDTYYYTDWVQQIEAESNGEFGGAYWPKGTFWRNKYIIPSCCTNTLLILDLESSSILLKRIITANINGFDGAQVDDQTIWLSPRYLNDPIVRWDILHDEVEEFYPYEKDSSNTENIVCPFAARFIISNEKVFFPPNRSMQGCYIDKLEKSIHLLPVEAEKWTYQPIYEYSVFDRILWSTIIDGKIYLGNGQDFMIYKYDARDLKLLDSFYISRDAEGLNVIKESLKEKLRIESFSLDLPLWLQCISTHT